MVQTLTTAEFQEKVLGAEKVVLVDFYADWCVPCKMFAPVFDAVAEELGDQMVFGKLNVDENMEIAENYQVSHIPTLILFKDGKVLNRISQSLTKADLREFIRANIR
ncbi:MAG: thioredoxin [Lachnospiraceae bacterium]|nr:thioredoxin [Lachnospiraceae bacterium]